MATQKVQANNRRTNKQITLINKETKEQIFFNTYRSCAEYLGIAEKTLKRRILKGVISDEFDFVI